VGVILTMTPHVNENNQVTLQLEPEVSNIVGWVGAEQDMPMTRVRKTKTTVRVENGQTIFLAGLLSEETSVSVAKIPLLGDIPLIGRLFQHKTDKTTKKNLIIEITPTILWDSTSIEMRQSNATGDALQTEPRAQPAPAQQPNELEPAEATPPVPTPAPAAPVDKKK